MPLTGEPPNFVETNVPHTNLPSWHTRMTPDELEILKEQEFALYEAEVGSSIEAKLHIVLAHLYTEHLLERYIARN